MHPTQAATPKLSTLHPFVSLTVLKVGTLKGGKAAVAELLADLEAGLRQREPDVRQIASSLQHSGAFQCGLLTFEVLSRPRWTSVGDYIDVSHQLCLLCRTGAHVFIYCSDPSLQRFMQRRLSRREGPFASVERIAPAILNAAFVREQTRTLWLSGLHQRTTTKADNKVLAGKDLQYALDPLADQSYYFTAARSRLHLGGQPETIGVAPFKSRVWLGPSGDWNSYLEKLAALDQALSTGRSEPSPLPCLSATISADHLEAVREAFDAAILPAVAVDSDEFDEDLRQRLEAWESLVLEISPREGPNFDARLHRPSAVGREFVGELSVTVIPDGEAWQLEHAWTPAGAENAEHVDALIDALRSDPTLLKVWYESGHVMTGDSIHLPKFRDLPFDGFEWVKFPKTKYDITREKPEKLAAAEIGRGGSLFCWVFNEWLRSRPGWLGCTDGSMEMADFVHLDDSSTIPILTLIHAKGSPSAQPEREISVSSYEVVTSQAIKNLRHLDREILASRIADRIDSRLVDAIWNNGQQSGRAEMKKALEKLGSRFRRQVVILQPQVTNQALGRSDAGRSYLRAVQLHTLLLGAQANCHALGASLTVIGEDVPKPTSKKVAP